ncbi:MAG: ATP-binding protein [Firmicutes bacterium]|nr:ATP-binding protein [Bacillota bacterium]
MSAIILIGGYPGAGKTAFSLRLSAELGIPCFNKDHMKNVLWEHFRFSTREESLRFSMAAFGLLRYAAERFIKAGKPAIIESNFRPPEAEALKSLFDETSCRSLAYLFVGDLRAIHRRFVERESLPERGEGNRMHGLSDDFGDFAEGVKTLGEVDFGGKTVRVDATDFGKVDYEGLIREAVEFIGGMNL